MLNYKQKYFQKMIVSEILIKTNKIGLELDFKKLEEQDIFNKCHILQKNNLVENVILNIKLKKAEVILKKNSFFSISTPLSMRNFNREILRTKRSNIIRINPELEDNC